MLSLDDVLRGREVVRRHLTPTPLRASFAVPALLKLECWQPTGSFKVRGALNVLAGLSEEERARGVTAASAGNHALGVAFAALATGARTRVTLFVPRTAPRAKVEKLRTFPVEVLEAGTSYDEAHAAALEHVARTGARYLHAFEDALTAAGQGTIALELLEQRPDVGTVVVPVGGGGLIAGVATVLKALAPGVRVVAVQPQASPALAESIRQGRPLLEFAAGETLADGLAGGIGQIAFDHRHLIDEIVDVRETDLEDAMVALLEQDQLVVEGAGAVGVAAVRTGRIRPIDARPVAVIVTGANVDTRVLARLLASRF